MSTLPILISHAQTHQDALSTLVGLSTVSLPSQASRRAYSASMRRFLESGASLDRSGVQAYMNQLREQGKGAATRNIALAAIRLLAREANERALLSDIELAAISRVKSTKITGSKIGNWLDIEGVKLLLAAAHNGRHATRNQALVALMVGCGLRRSEVVGLEWEQIQTREGRKVIVDLIGKGQRSRSIPIPGWVAAYLERWKEEQNNGQ